MQRRASCGWMEITERDPYCAMPLKAILFRKNNITFPLTFECAYILAPGVCSRWLNYGVIGPHTFFSVRRNSRFLVRGGSVSQWRFKTLTLFGQSQGHHQEVLIPPYWLREFIPLLQISLIVCMDHLLDTLGKLTIYCYYLVASRTVKLRYYFVP